MSLCHNANGIDHILLIHPSICGPSILHPLKKMSCLHWNVADETEDFVNISAL